MPDMLYNEKSSKSYQKVNICEIVIVLTINSRTTEANKTVLG